LGEGLEEMKQAGTFKVERVILTPQATSVRVQGRKDPVDVFCANNVSDPLPRPATVRQRAGRSTWGCRATQT
jgi:hypothetical protein